MPTVLRSGTLRIVIYPNDHDPPHAHVIGPDGEAKIALATSGHRPHLLQTEGLSRRELGAALREVDAHSALLWECWRDIHGRD